MNFYFSCLPSKLFCHFAITTQQDLKAHKKVSLGASLKGLCRGLRMLTRSIETLKPNGF